METNYVSLRSLYPSAMGQTVATTGTGVNAQTGQAINGPSPATPANDSPDPVSRAVAIGGQASPVVAGLVLAALLVGFMFLAKKLGTDDDFRSIRPTIYNGLTISAAAIIFIPLWKYLFTRFPIPGASTWVLAA